MAITLLYSSFNDKNIFHFFALEIKAVWDNIANDPSNYALFLQNFQMGDPIHEWRFDLLKAILPVHTSQDTVPPSVHIVPLKITAWIVDPWSFVKYKPDNHWLAFAQRVKTSLNTIQVKGTHAVFVSRKKSRILFDAETKKPLETIFKDVCTKGDIPHRIVCFDNATLQEQALALADAKVMLSCHGAGNTNVFFLPENGHLIELNFRRHWYCDPVCDEHYFEKIPYTTKCEHGKLTWRPYFHKADYHNMAHLFNKGYTELDMEYANGFLDRNPINVKHIYVNATKVMSQVLALF